MPDSDRSTKRSANFYAGPALVTLLAVQIIIGYEWLASGITKVASGDFVSGLAANLKGNLDAPAHWYRDFLTGTVIPNAKLFAVLIWVGEVLVGIGLIAAAIVWLARWSRLSDRWRVSILAVTMLSALGATFMAINFHLANGGNHPWLIPHNGFNETIDVDSMLVMVQAAYFVFCGYILVKIRREHRAASTSPAASTARPASSAGASGPLVPSA